MRLLLLFVMIPTVTAAAEPTCEGHCGGKSEKGECQCDDSCVAWHACCADKEALCPTCKPSCKAKQCGDDGCGGSCGTCGFGAPCVANLCGCVPECGKKVCGGDGCGGSCGVCQGGQTCDSGGACETPTVEPVGSDAGTVAPEASVTLNATSTSGCAPVGSHSPLAVWLMLATLALLSLSATRP